MTLFSRIRLFGLILGLFAISACDTAEERAEGHYQRGLQLLAEGKETQALLEFKNALQLNQDAIGPRLEFARVRLAQGEYRGAIANYLKVIELDEQHLEARVTTGRLYLQFDPDADSAREHIMAAAQIAPENEEVRGLMAGLALKEGRDKDAEQLARALLEDAPGNPMAVSVLVAQKDKTGDNPGIVALIDRALASNPEELSLHVAKLQALENMEDQSAIGIQLEEMAGLFPDNVKIAQGRVQWLLNTGDQAGALAGQRAMAEQFPDDPNHALAVAALLHKFDGPEMARGELMTLARDGEHAVPFNRALADFEFQEGNPEIAIRVLEELIETDISRDDQNDAQAQMGAILRETGDRGRALSLAEDVLKDDAEHVEALKLRALNALDEDKPHNAISDLRTALGVTPQDSNVLMILALAHERNGSPSLAQERLALAVQTSDTGITESLRYAEFLTRQDKADIALGVIKQAIAKHGNGVALLAGLGQVQLVLSDWSGATDTVAQLARQRQDPEAVRIAQEMQVAILRGEERFAQSIGVLREMWDYSGEATSAMENLVSSYMRTGRTDEAADFLDNILQNDRANMRANLLRGALHAFIGEVEAAEFRYRKVIDDHPTAENGYGALASLLAGQGRTDEANQIIQDGIANAQNSARLLFARASQLEQEQNYEGAISIYEQLYASNQVSDVLANNLASLLSEFRDDPESLERAYNISKRLRASKEPAFLDTYGWVLYRRGEYELALKPLEEAAKGAPNNAFVQYHLGMVYEKLGKKELATEQLTRAIELGQSANLPVLENAKAVLATLQGG